MGKRKKGGAAEADANLEDAEVSEKSKVVEAAPSPKQSSSTRAEIDAIFSMRGKGSKSAVQTVGKSTSARGATKKARSDVGKNGIGDSKPTSAPKRPAKRTLDGFAVYKEEELGWNKKDAGGPAACPFDCDCCFEGMTRPLQNNHGVRGCRSQGR